MATDWPVKNREIVINSIGVDFEKGRKSLRLREIDNTREKVNILSQKIKKLILKSKEL